jgi:hypothetical protein
LKVSVLLESVVRASSAAIGMLNWTDLVSAGRQLRVEACRDSDRNHETGMILHQPLGSFFKLQASIPESWLTRIRAELGCSNTVRCR